MAADLVIRNGRIVDGTGAPSYIGDVAIVDGKISAVGPKLDVTAEQEIDATGKIVAPAWIDCHTHLDAQIMWDPWMAPATTNGIGTVVFGNCGCGFAPCVKEDRNFLIELMEGVEDIPKASLEEGMGDWGWETFPEWLDYAETLHTACDFAALIAHGAVRTYVMGERGADHQEETTPGDLQAMHAVVRQAVEAGAIGFASNRADGHQDMSGNPVPGTYAKDDEVVTIAEAVNSAGGGVFECVSGFLMDNSLTIALKERELYEQISTAGGPNMPIVFNIHPFTDEWNNDTLAWLTNCHAKGMPLYGCTSVKAIATLASMESNVNPFMAASPTYLQLSVLDREERVGELSRPKVKEAVLAECYAARDEGRWRGGGSGYPMVEAPGEWIDFATYEPQPENMVKEIAKREGRDPIEYLYDHFLTRDGRGTIYQCGIGYGVNTPYGANTLDGMREMMTHPCCVIGLADSGAHVGAQTDSCNATYLMSYWVRDRNKLTGRDGIELEHAVYLHTKEPADICGLTDRGVLQVGLKADINVIDMEKLRIQHPYVAYELPTGAKIWTQDVVGYDYTIISGVITFKDNVKTGALPGGLVRNPRTQHVRDAGAVSEVDLAFVMAQRGPATRPLIGRGDVGGMGASQIGRRFREELAEAAKQLNLQKANL